MTPSNSLRALADFLDVHADLDIRDQSVTILHYVSTRAKLADIARKGSWRKVLTDSWYELHADFGNGIIVQVYTDRANVCRRVVKVQRTVPAKPAEPERVEDIVEWICEEEPLLAEMTL